MEGLEKIAKSIMAEADNEGEKIKKEAEEKAKAIFSEFEMKKTRLTRESGEETQKVCMQTAQRIEAEANSAAREIILTARTKAINEILSYVKSSVINAPADEYFKILARLFEKNREKGAGVIYFNKKDSERLPKEFCAMLEKSDITISEKTGDFSGGFIIEYGKIDVNCTIESLFQDKKNEFSDIINGVIV